jgi:DNA polymerase-3 subunit delta
MACYLFLGPELGEKQDAIDEIRAKLKAAHSAPAEEISFYAGETPTYEILSILRNGSLFADARLVFIKNAEALKKKDEVDALAAYMTETADNTELILLSTENSLAKAIENAAPKRIFWEMFENRKRDWVSSFFKKQGVAVTPDCVDVILELVENNTEALRQECSRLCQFLGKDKTITAEDAEKWLSRGREESAFTLFSKIASGDLSKALETLRALLHAKEAPPAILAGLTWCFQKLLDYLFLLEDQKANDTELKKIGLAAPKARKDYEQAGRLYGVWGVQTCLALTAEYDALIRSMGSGLENLLMDRYIYQIWRVKNAALP